MIISSGTISKLAICGLIMVAIGCQEKKAVIQNSSNNEKLGASKGLSGDAEDGKGEEVSPPSNITGTYLHCSAVTVPFDAPDASSIGCAVYDNATDARVNLANLVKSVDWGYDRTLSPNGEITIFKAAATDQLDHDVYYSFTKYSGPFTDILAKFVVTMDVIGLNDQRQVYRNNQFSTKPATTQAPRLKKRLPIF